MARRDKKFLSFRGFGDGFAPRFLKFISLKT